jgi:hypothetical protein
MPPLASLILLLAAHPVSAASLSGIVYDQTGAPIPDVQVILKLEGPAPPQRTTATNASGRFTFADVKANAYELRMVHTGYKVLRYVGVQVPEGADLDLPASVLPVGSENSCMGAPKSGVIRRLRDKAKYLFVKRPSADTHFCM